jgi:hypothetical protein
MTFAKLKCDTAYATGAIRTNLDMPLLIAKLKRNGLDACMQAGRLLIACDGETWELDDWQPDGIGLIGWIEVKMLGDVGVLSRRLARAGIRHKFDYSRPRDLQTSDIRCVTQYDYRWDTPGMAPRAAVMPEITTFEEQL